MAAPPQSTETIAKLLGGKRRLERRTGAPRIFARTYVQGKNVVSPPGERLPPAATKVATDWYLELRGRAHKGEHLHGHSFASMADAFISHANQLREVSEGQRRNYRQKWTLLKPHFEGVKIADIDARFLLTLRETRSRATTKNGQPVKPATLKKDFDFFRLTMRPLQQIEKCLDELPEFPSFRGEAWEVTPNPRPFLDHEQWAKVRK